MILKKYITTFFVGVLALLLQSCATRSVVATKVEMNMTPEQVKISVGKPWSKNTYKDSDGSAHEEWIYRETTWDDAGWSWDRTMFNTYVIFKDGRVEAIIKDPNEIFKTRVFLPHQPPQVNIQQNNF